MQHIKRLSVSILENLDKDIEKAAKSMKRSKTKYIEDILEKYNTALKEKQRRARKNRDL